MGLIRFRFKNIYSNESITVDTEGDNLELAVSRLTEALIGQGMDIEFAKQIANSCAVWVVSDNTKGKSYRRMLLAKPLMVQVRRAY